MTKKQRRRFNKEMLPWWIRTLRHERFSRNEDGSLKTILVEPILVGTNSLDEVDERPTEELRPFE